MIDAGAVPITAVAWSGARRIIRSMFPPIDLFDDISDPADWPLLIAAEQKTNPRLMVRIGMIDLVPEKRRVSGPGASYLMAPFTHVSADRPSRFSDGRFGVLYVADRFETALAETVHHHQLFMRRTGEPAGWTSQFRELVMELALAAHDVSDRAQYHEVLDPDDYAPAQQLGAALRDRGSDGILYPSVRDDKGRCVALLHPDLARSPTPGRHLDYHWNGKRVDFIREARGGRVYEIEA